jgi:pseudaminic acid biosynthesis-associated methylase
MAHPHAKEDTVSTFKTFQEELWANDFGDEYFERNLLQALPRRIEFFKKVLKKAGPINSVLELGAGVGLNLHALGVIFPKAEFKALEINAKAAEHLKALEWLKTLHEGSLLDPDFKDKAELVLTFGLLIHIHPDYIKDAYAKIYSATEKYMCFCEYYNPEPQEITYRGHKGLLVRRDFAGEMMDQFPDLKLVDYGFAYRRDPVLPGGDVTWFLLEKT